MSASAALLAAAAIGAGVGSAARYGAEVLQSRSRTQDGLVPSGRELPVATLAVNVVGSALLGLVAALALGGHLDPVVTTALGAGVAGGLTTFSTFALEVVTLVRAGRPAAAAAYVLATLALGVAAAATAFQIGVAGVGG